MSRDRCILNDTCLVMEFPPCEPTLLGIRGYMILALLLIIGKGKDLAGVEGVFVM